ncbi:MAG: penicillin-binding protein activator [Steroidobacteraceae bacterium]
MQHNPLVASRATAICLLALLLAGCISASPPGRAPASVNRAEQLLQQNNPAAAAQVYEQLAQDNPPPDRNDFALAAARAWLAANRADDAQRVIDTAASSLTTAQQFERDLVRGEIAMARGQYAPAWQQVSKVAEPVRPADAARLFLLQQQLALRAGLPVEAVRAALERDRVATSDSERTRARRDLLNDLRTAIDRGLRFDPAASRDALVRGWLEIGQIAAAAGQSPLAAPAAIEGWRNRFPGHPAATIAASEILALGGRAQPRSGAVVASTSPVALLLPLGDASPQTRNAAALTRDGFMAAIARLPEAARPAVRVYDTAAITVAAAMQKARTEGAGIAVGPLTKAEVQTAVEQRPSDLPLLLLNNLAGSGFAGANIYQYALAPEDEARQIARQMAGTGQRNAMVLVPAGDWGNRVKTAFIEELTRAGGRVVVQGNYDLNGNDLTSAVTTALGLDESRERYTRIRQITQAEFGFEPRPRPEIDAIFVAGYKDQINPLLQIYPLLHRYAEDIPVYMTQDGLDADLRANRELVGIYLLDMPWLLDTAGPTADLRAATESVWGARGLRQSRYFAFGFDAANLALAIRGGSTSSPLPGLTGRLNFTPDGRVERSLNWARVNGEGAALPAEPAAR